MEIRASEISSILKDQIKNFGQEAEVSESARCSPSATASPVSTDCRERACRGACRVPERRRGNGAEPGGRQRRIVVFGENRAIKEGDTVNVRARSGCRSARRCWAGLSTGSEIR